MARQDRIAEPWGSRTPYGPGDTWPTRVDSHLADGVAVEDVERWVQSASILHSNGDALDIAETLRAILLSSGGDILTAFAQAFHIDPACQSLKDTLKAALDETLPMMHMDDAVRATIELMSAPVEAITERGSYNIAGVSFSPAEIAAEIARQSPGFRIEYAPDYRQAIAAAWPNSLDDSQARHDWGWRATYNLSRLVSEMLAGMKKQISIGKPARAANG